MNSKTSTLDAQYLSCLSGYLKGEKESALACAYDIVRLANAQGISMLELLSIHQHALDDLLRKTKTR